MLVLSRRPDEKILLPSIPVVIKVIASQAGLTRLGIDAPADVPILREELYGDRVAPAAGRDAAPRLGARHDARARLHNLNLALGLLRLQLKDASAAVRQTLDGLEEELRALRRQLGVAGPREGLTLVGRAGA